MGNQMLNFAQKLVKTNQNNIPNAPWRDADPAMRKELKANMQQAINEMPA